MLNYSPEIKAARASGKPIVALESTIITHGMPYPENLQTARELESLVRESGAFPATIAVLEGSIHIGLDNDQLETLASAKNVMKLSRADLGYAVSQKRHGSTTVAATMQIAHLAGIEVFATGGIGGVHRGVADHFDISADLGEFTRSKVIVVCAGAKAILDIPKTLEVLETNGVPVVGYQCDDFPAFWSRSSGEKLSLRLDTPVEIASFQRVREALGDLSGMLIGNPIPSAAEIKQSDISPAISTALLKAEHQGITGKAVTPFLLQTLYDLTEGRSLVANKELVFNNARVAGQIAVSLNDMRD